MSNHKVVLCDDYLLSGYRPQYVFPRPIYNPEVQEIYMARDFVELSSGETVRHEIMQVKLDVSAARR